MRTMLPRRRRTLTMPSHFWYLVKRCMNMLRVVLVDSDRRRGILAQYFMMPERLKAKIMTAPIDEQHGLASSSKVLIQRKFLISSQ